MNVGLWEGNSPSWVEREADHTPPANVEAKNAWSYTSTHPYIFMTWCLIKGYVCMALHLVKHSDNLTFLLS
jgi:hypothetical protein